MYFFFHILTSEIGMDLNITTGQNAECSRTQLSQSALVYQNFQSEVKHG